LSLSPECLRVFEEELPLFKDKIILRPQEISNNPEVIRRLGIIAINSGLEADIYGNVNSTHFLGSRMMNGIGGSGDFARNARLSIFAFPSVAKGGTISSIVPMVSHVDHTEHDVMVIVTEQGLADIRGLSPRRRAETIIEKCAHPEFKDQLRSYTVDAARWSGGHTPHNLEKALSWHIKLKKEGSMI
jgi:succinyl-CoA:acetate CoA-transferase